jgi:uncharacterized protein (TIGR03435 family)
MYRSIPILIVAFGAAFAQSPQSTFEVASVKPSTPQSVRMFDGMMNGGTVKDPGMIAYTRATLDDLLTRAYDLVDREQISGPAWLGTEPYDIFAKIPQGTTTEQFRAMMRTLLEERFKLSVHHLTKDFPVYELVIAKNGPKFKEPGEPSTAAKPGMAMRLEDGRARLTSHQEPLSMLAGMLRQPAGRQVIDKTGLTGKYDFMLEFSVRGLTAAPGDDPLPSLFEALPQQLGLRLEDKKAPFDVVVVDHAEKVPTEN